MGELMLSRIAICLTALLAFASCSKNNDTYFTYAGIMDVNSVRVSAQTPAMVASLTCEEGLTVHKGDTLATVETEKLGYQMDQSQSVIDEIDHQYQAAALQMKAAMTNRDNLKIRYERFSALLRSNAATQQSVDDLKTQLDAANEQLEAAKASLASLLSKKQQINSGMNVTRKQLHDANIVTPITGTILVKYTEVGELLTIGSPVCEIANLSELWTKIYISEKNLYAVKIGQKVQIQIDGLPQKTLEGSVTWISDKSEFTPKTILTEETRTTLVFPAKVTVKNPEGILKIGMPVSVLVPKGS